MGASRALRAVGIVALGAMALGAVALTGCGGGDDSGTETSDSAGEAAGGSLSAVAEADPTDLNDELTEWTPPEVGDDVASIDRRPALLGQLGGPDAFVITVDEIDGTVSRFESWSYFEARTQIDLVDGEILWDIEIDPLPDDTHLPLMYSPTEFTMLATADETLGALADVELFRIEADADLEEPGTELWAGEQLLLAFVDDRLIYVETFPLAPESQEVVS